VRCDDIKATLYKDVEHFNVPAALWKEIIDDLEEFEEASVDYRECIPAREKIDGNGGETLQGLYFQDGIQVYRVVIVGLVLSFIISIYLRKSTIRFISYGSPPKL